MCRSAETYARENEIGLWEKSTEKCSECITLEILDPEEEYFIIENNCENTCELTGWLVKDDANHHFNLRKIEGKTQEKYVSEGKVWNNNGDRYFMRDGNGKLVIFYEY